MLTAVTGGEALEGSLSGYQYLLSGQSQEACCDAVWSRGQQQDGGVNGISRSKAESSDDSNRTATREDQANNEV